MTDEEFTEYKCPLCNSINIDETLGICLDCGYDGLQDKALGYTIECNASDYGNATVSTPYGDITDGETCIVPYDTPITITATPDEHYQFSAWAGANATLLGSSNPVSLIVKGDISFGVTFAAQKTLTVAAFTHGNATINGELLDVAGETLYFDADTEITVVAIPDADYVHKTWACTAFTSAQNVTLSVTDTMSTDYTMALEFQLLTAISYVIYTQNDSGSTKIKEYSSDGKNVTITYTPASGQEIKAVYVCDISDEDEILTPEITTGITFIADMEAANDYIILVVFGATS